MLKSLPTVLQTCVLIGSCSYVLVTLTQSKKKKVNQYLNNFGRLPCMDLWIYGWKTLALMLSLNIDSISVCDCGLYPHSIWINRPKYLFSNLSFTEWVAAAAIAAVAAAAAMNTDKPWFWDDTFQTQISVQHKTTAGWVHFSQSVIKQILCRR